MSKPHQYKPSRSSKKIQSRVARQKGFEFDFLPQEIKMPLPAALLLLKVKDQFLMPPDPNRICERVPATESERKIRTDDAEDIRRACAKRGSDYRPEFGGEDGQKAKIVGWLKEIGQSLNRAPILQEIYKYQKNPVLLWMIYLECRKYKTPIPENVLKYFDSIAEEVWKSASSGRAEKSWAEILKFKKSGKTGRGTVFSTLTDTEGLQLALKVHEKIKDGLSKTKAIKDVADKCMHGSESTVRRAWNKYQHLF